MASRALKTVGDIVEAMPKPEGLALLRQPFPAHQISKLPKPYKRDSVKGKCAECGGYHGLPAVHLDYVGHAALTDRLLDADPCWSWEPAGLTPEGLPALGNGGLWIKLTVCGVTRYGFGSADGKNGGDAMKEMIGDALRNAAMRFGAALDLWHKGDLHVEEEPDSKGDGSDASSPRGEGDMSDSALRGCIKTLVHNINGCATARDLDELLELDDCKSIIEQTKRRFPNWWETGAGLPPEFTPLKKLIDQTRAGLRQLETQE